MPHPFESRWEVPSAKRPHRCQTLLSGQRLRRWCCFGDDHHRICHNTTHHSKDTTHNSCQPKSHKIQAARALTTLCTLKDQPRTNADTTQLCAPNPCARTRDCNHPSSPLETQTRRSHHWNENEHVDTPLKTIQARKPDDVPEGCISQERNSTAHQVGAGPQFEKWWLKIRPVCVHRARSCPCWLVSSRSSA